MEEYILVKPSQKYSSQIASYRQEFLDSGDSMDGTGNLRRASDPSDFIANSEACENPETLPEGLVTATQYLFIRKNDDRLIGMIQIRHYFNEYLEKFGGHIGYSVRPTERRKGCAKKMLEMTLPLCKELGLDKILITCLADNTASEKTIIANGGIYENTVHEPNANVDLKRYWIEIK